MAGPWATPAIPLHGGARFPVFSIYAADLSSCLHFDPMATPDPMGAPTEPVPTEADVQSAFDIILPSQRCTATSKTTGAQCAKTAIQGGTVCRYHGGAAPQVVSKAARRIEEARDLALSVLVRRMTNDGDMMDPKVLLEAVVKLTDKHELLEGRATDRKETHHTERTEELRATLTAKLDELAYRREKKATK